MDGAVRVIMLRPLCECKEIEDLEILNRSKESSKCRVTHQYIAYKDGNEIAFVSLDIDQEIEYLVLYDLLVPLSKRKKGFGTFVLSEVENLAKNLGFRRVVLNPIPFEGNYPKEKLIDWYCANGYESVANGTGEMEKYVEG